MNDALHRELWTSWASLLRSYSAAHGLNSTQHAVIEVGSNVIVLRVNTRWLQFTHNEMIEDNNTVEPFQINLDGTITIGSVTEEMDFTAERLTREIMQRERHSS